MNIDKIAWKHLPWSVHPEIPHAIMIPGWGWYGGLPEDVARAIVEQMTVMQAHVGSLESISLEGL